MADLAISIVQADALTIDADVLVLKHAQALYGVDKAAAAQFGIPVTVLPGPARAQLIPRDAELRPSNLLFLGTRPLSEFDYSDARDFGRRAVAFTEHSTQVYRSIAMTVHGPGFGLDEAECFRALIAGIADGAPVAQGVERVMVVESGGRRAKRFQDILNETLPGGRLSSLTAVSWSNKASMLDAGAASNEKPHAFVAMPFAPEFDDLFHYGIQGAINTSGYLCERADVATFVGDVVGWVRERIERSEIVVADLTGANANVYLEVGYAWGKQIPTVLLARDVSDLKFDVRGQRCLIYKSIRHLEETLRGELTRLRDER